MSIVSTGCMLTQYMEANGVVISEVARKCNVSERTVYRILNDEARLTPEVAFAISELIPGLKCGFILKYDASYQVQKLQLERQSSLNIDKCISVFKLKKLFPEISTDKQALIERGIKVFGQENMAHCIIPAPQFAQYSKANNATMIDSNLWTIVAYKECLEKNDGKNLVFDYDAFTELFSQIRDICGTTSYENTVFNMLDFCESCGIYFYIRKSIPNARIKGMTIRDEEGRVFIILSDLFKCVEVLWLAFIHECIHINKKDFFNRELVEETNTIKNENYVSSETIKFFVHNYDVKNIKSVKEILDLSNRENVPVGIVTAITRYATEKYNDKEYNSLLHFYK